MRPFRFVLLSLFIVFITTGCVTRGDLTNNYETLPSRSDAAVKEDKNIINSLKEQIAAQPDLSTAHINVNSYNGYILLTGQVPTESLKAQLTQMAELTQGKKALLNDIEVGANASAWRRIQDTWITSRVLANLRANGAINPSRVRAITENGVVYLMGMIAPYEANSYVNTILPISGIKRIVKVFEYVS